MFLLTYGDGVADIDLNRLIDFHKAHGRIGTVSGVHSPSRFGKLKISNEKGYVGDFTEKPLESGISDYINGGYFVFNREFFKYVSSDESCILERKPLEKLAEDPYGAGWLIKVKLWDDAGLSNLMEYPAYQQQCAEEH